MSWRVFEALGQQTRWKILNQLRMGPKSVAQIAAKMKVSRPAVSQGLNILFAAGVVKKDYRGRQTFYGLNLAGLQSARESIEGLEDVAEKYSDREPGSDNR